MDVSAFKYTLKGSQPGETHHLISRKLTERVMKVLQHDGFYNYFEAQVLIFPVFQDKMGTNSALKRKQLDHVTCLAELCTCIVSNVSNL